MHYTTKQERLEALRDFFFAESATQLADAYAALGRTVFFDLPIVDDWDEVEFVFNRLFVGPQAPIAAPFGSVYLEPEPQVMGESTLQARRCYEMLGVRSPWQGNLPDDHLSLELEACIRMSALRKVGSVHEAEALWSYFLSEHLAKWLPLWMTQVHNAERVPEAILAVLDCLAVWLDEEIRELNTADTAVGT